MGGRDFFDLRMISGRGNPRLKEWAGLKHKSERDRLGLTLAEGAHLTREMLFAPAGGSYRARAFIISDSGVRHPEAAELHARAGELNLELYGLADDCYEKISGLANSEGMALLLEFSREADAAAASRLVRDPGARLLAAAGVQDPGNAGALCRVAEASGASGCLFLDGADPHSPKFLRGSMGSPFRLPCAGIGKEDFLKGAEASGMRVLLAENAPDAVDYREADYRPPVAVVVGSEGRGMPGGFSRLAPGRVRIPMAGKAESLNLAVAAGIIMFRAGEGWRSRPIQ